MSFTVMPPVASVTVPAVFAKIAPSLVPPSAGQTTFVTPSHQLSDVFASHVPVPPFGFGAEVALPSQFSVEAGAKAARRPTTEPVRMVARKESFDFMR